MARESVRALLVERKQHLYLDWLIGRGLSFPHRPRPVNLAVVFWLMLGFAHVPAYIGPTPLVIGVLVIYTIHRPHDSPDDASSKDGVEIQRLLKVLIQKRH